MSRDAVLSAFKHWDKDNLGIIPRSHLVTVLTSIGLGDDEIAKMMEFTSTKDELQYADFVDWVCFPGACLPEDHASMTASSLGRKCKVFLGANWKCSLQKTGDIDKLISDMNAFWKANGSKLASVELCVFPPYVFLDRVRQQLHPEISVGGQNAWDAAPGFSCTGVVTAEMLQAVGCRWVLLGHSDRRNSLGETDGLIHDKVDKCLAADLNINLTIGETLEARKAGNAITVLLGQLSAAVANVPPAAWSRIAVSYEPVWAIGDGATPCSPEDAQEVLASLRSWISENAGEEAARACRLLYTGSVNEKNADQYACLPDVDGFVVGRAGLDITKLAAICTKLAEAEAWEKLAGA